MVNKNCIFLLIVFLTACGSGNSDGSNSSEPSTAVYVASGQSNMQMKMDGTPANPGEMPALPGFIETDTGVSIIPTAIGSTSLDCWQVGGQCFELKIRPLIGKRIAGVFWWQGEWDAEVCDSSAQTYGDRFKKMVSDWRALFGPVPFYVVQLGAVPLEANIDPAVECGEGFSKWSEKWEQVKTGQNIPDVFLIKTSDITYGDIHPLYAYEEIARRISLILPH